MSVRTGASAPGNNDNNRGVVSSPAQSNRLDYVLSVGFQRFCQPCNVMPATSGNIGIPVPDPAHPSVQVNTDDVCVICLDPLDPNDPNEEIEALKCVTPFYKHQFHLSCILDYYDSLINNYGETRCPICRTDMTYEETDRFDDLLTPVVAPAPAPAPRAAQRRTPRQTPRQTPRPAPTPRRPVREKAFLYVMVRNLGFGGRTNRSGPHLLLIGHKQRNDKRHWGVPGGLKDRSDPNSGYTAVREFLEEMGINRSPNQADVTNAMTEMARRGSFQNVVPTNRSGFSAYGIVFDTAIEFERKMGLTNMLRSKGVQGVPTIKDKYYVDMSSETKGYTYVPIVPIVPGQPPSATVLPTFPVRPPLGMPYRAVRAANGLSAGNMNVTQLKLRRGVSERAMRNTRAMLW